MTNLEKSILATIVYYNSLNLPIMYWEIFEYLTLPKSLRGADDDFGSDQNLSLSILHALDGEVLRKVIDKKNGLYFLKERSDLFDRRMNFQKTADQKWKKVIKIVKRFQLVPFVKSVCVSGSLAFNHTGKQSDLDVFIIANYGRIWTVRFLLAFITVITGSKRFRNSKNVCDKICFNHFVSYDSFSMNFRSIYTAHIYARLEFVFGSSEIVRVFYGNNKWINDYLPNFCGEEKVNQRFIKRSWRSFFGRMGEWTLGGSVGDFIEKCLRRIQLRAIKKGSQRSDGLGRVIVSDNELEFHPNSPEKGVLDRYNKKMEELGLSDFTSEYDSGLS